MEIQRDGERKNIIVSQKQYISSLINSNGLTNCKSQCTPIECKLLSGNEGEAKEVDAKIYQSLFGSLLYLSLTTRPDIAHSVNKLSQFNQKPFTEHLNAPKQILKYLLL